jgi:hypothetical protein
MKLSCFRKKASLKQEKAVASSLLGRTTPASGAMRNPRHKGDVTSKHFRVEAKLTERASYSLSKKVLDKIEMEALRNVQIPILVVDIQGARYAVLRWQDFHSISHDAGLIV